MIFMGLSAVLCFFSAIILCVSMAGASNTDDIIKSSSWTLGYIDNSVDYWFGLKSYYYSAFGISGTISYDSNACNVSFCDKCSQAGETALNSSAIAFICCVVAIITSALRIRQGGDKIVLKITSVLVSVIAWFCLVIGMASWANQCADNLPSSGVDYKLGPGFSCAVAAFIFLFTVILVHLFTPVDFSGAGDSGLSSAITVNS